eukprot:7425214-Pyramimonas_sp.AAC.1
MIRDSESLRQRPGVSASAARPRGSPHSGPVGPGRAGSQSRARLAPAAVAPAPAAATAWLHRR